MNINQCSTQLRVLVDQRANYQISFEDYRAQRKMLLDALDAQYNGVSAQPIEVLPEAEFLTQEQLDKTQPYLASKIGQCLSFLKRTNES